MNKIIKKYQSIEVILKFSGQIFNFEKFKNNYRKLIILLFLIYIPQKISYGSNNNSFIKFQAGPSLYSSDTLGSGLFLSLNFFEGFHKNWFTGIEFNQYFRRKDRVSGLWIPEYRVIENWLNISSLVFLFAWGEEYPRIIFKVGGCYIYSKKIILGLSPSPYIYSTKEFKPVLDIELSDILWLPKVPFGIALGVNGGIILLKNFYGRIGIGIIYKLGEFK